MQSEKILEDLKKGGSYCLGKDENPLGEINYEQHIFYIEDKDKYMIQYIDWDIFVQGGFNKNSIRFEYVDTYNAKILIESLLEEIE